MRVFIGPARASSLREDGSDLQELLGGTAIELSYSERCAGEIKGLITFDSDWPKVQLWGKDLPRDSKVGLLIMFAGATVYAEEAGLCVGAPDYKRVFYFKRLVPAPFLPTQLL